MSKQFEYDENDPRTYEEQYEAWKLCADTLVHDLTTYPGGSAEQGTRQPPKVITKRGQQQ